MITFITDHLLSCLLHAVVLYYVTLYITDVLTDGTRCAVLSQRRKQNVSIFELAKERHW